MASKDRLRWLVVAAAGMLLVVLAADYTRQVVSLPDGIPACLAHPAELDGTRLVLPVWFVAGVDGPDRYRVSRVAKDVPVQGDTQGMERGQVITLVGRWRGADGVVVEERHQIHTLRPYKKALSLAGLVLALVAAPLTFTWRDGYLRLRRDEGGPDA